MIMDSVVVDVSQDWVVACDVQAAFKALDEFSGDATILAALVN